MIASTPTDPTQVVFRNVAIPMRDGVILRGDLFLPARDGSIDRSATYPTILLRTPYNKSQVGQGETRPKVMTDAGYAFLAQDVRGTNASDGQFSPMRDESWGERQDGRDTIEWIRRQPWSDGQIATHGFSYHGGVQLLAHTMKIPGLVTGFIQAPAVNQFGGGWVYAGDALELSTAFPWALMSTVRSTPDVLDAETAGVASDIETFGWDPRRDEQDIQKMFGLLDGRSLADAPIARHLPFWRQWLEHRDDRAFFEVTDALARLDCVTQPLMFFCGWYDLFLRNTLAAYSVIGEDGATDAARNGRRLIIGPWAHVWNPAYRQFPDNAHVDDTAMLRAWTDQQLRGIANAAFDHPVTLYVMGANRWRAEESWPLRGETRLTLFLHSEGAANSAAGDGSLSPAAPVTDHSVSRYAYDPADPTPSLGGHTVMGGSADQRPNAARRDILVYTTAPLHEDLEVTGQVTATIWAASSAEDTDFYVRLIDVFPDGAAYNIAAGWVRARYRNSRTEPQSLTHGEVVRYEVDLAATSNVFEAGHRIRVEISSADYPNHDLNPNRLIDLSTWVDGDAVKAEQTIHHDAVRPSSINLPVIPADRPRRWMPTPFPPGEDGWFFQSSMMNPEQQGKSPIPTEAEPDALPTTE